MAFLVLSFIAGVLTVLAPCILPLLPVIVGRSIADPTVSRRRLITVILSLGGSVILFTLLLKASTLLIDIPQDVWKWISAVIIGFFGLTMVFPKVWESFSFTSKISAKSNKVLSKGYQKDSIWGDVIVGASLGPIFSACSPTYFVILATVLPATPLLGLTYLLVFVLGLCLALALVAFLGQKIVEKLGIVADSGGWFKKIFGLIFILVAVGIGSGFDKKLEIKILDSGFLDVTKIEQRFLDDMDSMESSELLPEDQGGLGATEEMSEEQSEKAGQSVSQEALEVKEEKFLSVVEKRKLYPLAPDISTPDAFFNTNGQEINISDYRGDKVVLLDIWTYSCINCQRTLPYLNAWHKMYEDEGLVIIGLHTPEFSFERVEKNVGDAVEEFDIKYPVVMDNDFSTWNAYRNRYWPRKYLIDIDGFVVYDHAGEGAYDETEEEIQKLLRERAQRLGLQTTTAKSATPSGVVNVDFSQVNSPEVYFGAWRNSLLANGVPNKNGVENFTIPKKTDRNKVYLGGTWNITTEDARGGPGAELLFKYDAKNVYTVASSETGAVIEVYLDGKLSKTVDVKDELLYPLVEGDEYEEHKLELKVKSGTVNLFTFTFG